MENFKLANCPGNIRIGIGKSTDQLTTFIPQFFYCCMYMLVGQLAPNLSTTPKRGAKLRWSFLRQYTNDIEFHPTTFTLI